MELTDNSQTLEFEGYVLNLQYRYLRDPQGEEHNLTPRLFDTLLHLARNPGRIVTKDELLEAVWGDCYVEENNLSQNISQLRKLLGESPGERRFIETITGRGFRFLPEVRESGPITDVSHSIEPNPEETVERPVRVTTKWLLITLGVISIFAASIAYYLFAGTNSVSTQPRKIAVLPFRSLVPGAENPPLELRITYTLISKLRGGNIDVKPFSSIRRYAGEGQDPIAAGRELGVEAVLDGSVNAVGDRIRISARLTRPSDGALIWSGQFDEDFRDVFSVQDSISERVASALKTTLATGSKKTYTENAEAYKLFLQGRYLSQRARPEDIKKSIGYFENALAADPNYAPAYVGIADASRALVLLAETPPEETLSRAKAAADRAVAIDDEYAEGHAVRGWLAFWYDWNWAKAEDEAKRSIDLDPRSSDAHQFYAHLLSNTGRNAEALSEIQVALELEPLSLRANSFQGMFLFNAGRNEEAVAQFRKVLDLDPQYRLALMFGARALSEMGDYENALKMVRNVQDAEDAASDPIAVEASILAMSGRAEQARKLLTRLEKESLSRYISPYNLALVHQRLGDSDRALDLLEQAYGSRDIRMVFLNVEPAWRSLRSSPRFAALLRKLNFPSASTT